MNPSGTEPTIGNIVWGYNLDTRNIIYGRIDYTRNYFGNTRLYLTQLDRINAKPIDGECFTGVDIVAFNLEHLREKIIEYINQIFDQFIENETRKNTSN